MKVTGFFLSTLILIISGSTVMGGQQTGTGYLHHVVIFWLKKPGDAEDRAALIEVSKTLKTIPGVVSVSVGLPVASERSVVDDSFDVAATIVFENEAAEKNYQTHPVHIKAKDEVLKSLVERFIVYDFIE